MGASGDLRHDEVRNAVNSIDASKGGKSSMSSKKMSSKKPAKKKKSK